MCGRAGGGAGRQSLTADAAAADARRGRPPRCNGAGQPAPRASPPPPAPAARGHGPRRDTCVRERRSARSAAKRERGWVDAEAIVRQFKGGDGITLDLLNMLGDVVVVGGKGREGRLSIVRRVQGRGADNDRC